MAALSAYPHSFGSRYGSSIDMKGSATALNEALENIMSNRKEAEAHQEHLRLARKLIKDRENEARKLQREKENEREKKLKEAEERDVEFQKQVKKAKSMWSTTDNIICGADNSMSADLGTGVTNVNINTIDFDYQGQSNIYQGNTFRNHNQPIYTGTSGNEFIFGDIGGVGGSSGHEEETYVEEMQEAIKSTKKNNKRKFKL